MMHPMKHDLDLYIRARYALLWLVTPEEERALAELDALAQLQRKRILYWSYPSGVTNPAKPDWADTSLREPSKLLRAIEAEPEASIWVLRDFHPFLKDPGVVRLLREVALALEKSSKTIVLLSPVLEIPRELEKQITVVDLELPTADELDAQLEAIIEHAQRHQSIQVELDRRQRARLVQACLGLTARETANAVAKAITQMEGPA